MFLRYLLWATWTNMRFTITDNGQNWIPQTRRVRGYSQCRKISTRLILGQSGAIPQKQHNRRVCHRCWKGHISWNATKSTFDLKHKSNTLGATKDKAAFTNILVHEKQQEFLPPQVSLRLKDAEPQSASIGAYNLLNSSCQGPRCVQGKWEWNWLGSRIKIYLSDLFIILIFLYGW